MNNINKYLFTKLASAYPGYNGMAFQQFLPVQQSRKLSDSELDRIEEEKGKLIPKIFKSRKDNPAVDMSSPAASSVIGAILGGVPLALLGGALGNKEHANTAAIAGGVGGSLLGSIVGHKLRTASNESIEDSISRLPEGATRRDIMSDPVYWQEKQILMENRRNAIMAAVLAGR